MIWTSIDGTMHGKSKNGTILKIYFDRLDGGRVGMSLALLTNVGWQKLREESAGHPSRNVPERMKLILQSLKSYAEYLYGDLDSCENLSTASAT